MNAPTTGHRTRVGFYLLLLWLIALPWPLGANRDWIWPWFSAALLVIAALSVAAGDGLRDWRTLSMPLRIALIATVVLVDIDLLRALTGSVSADAAWSVADVDAARLGALKSVSVLVFGLMLIVTVNSRRRARWLLGALFICAIAQALLALGSSLAGYRMVILGHVFDGGELARGTFINRNHFAGMLELAGAAGFGLLASGLQARTPAEDWREWLRRFGHALLGSRFAVRAGLAVLVVALVLTRSRMGNAAFFFGLTAAGMAALLWWRPLPRILIWLLLSIVAIDLLVLGAWVGVDKVAERVAQTQWVAPVQDDETQSTAAPAKNTEPSDGERLAVARGTLAMWRERPWLGHGAGSFRMVFPRFKPESVGLFYENAHNDYLQLLAERGVAGFVLALAAVLGLLWSAIAAVRASSDSLSIGLGLTSIAAMAAFGAHSMVDFNLQIPANLFWFVTCAALGALALRLPKVQRRRRSPTDALADDAT